jgi:hypothetical protein
MGSKKLSPEQKWHEQAEAFKREAEKLPYGREREDLLRKASQLETASTSTNGYRRRGLSRQVPARVADNRAYAIGHDGHFSDCEARSCEEDRDAIEWARH